VDAIEPHDDAPVDPEEPRGIEPLLEGLHPLTDDVGLLADVNFGVRTARGDVLDRLDRHHSHLPAHLDGYALEIRRPAAMAAGWGTRHSGRPRARCACG